MRPHRIAIGAVESGQPRYQFPATIARSIFVGDILQYDVDVAGQIISIEVATRGGEPVLAQGTGVFVSWRPQDTYLFGASP